MPGINVLLLGIFYLILLMSMATVLTTLPFKLVRLCLDTQYGTATSSIKISAYPRHEMTLSNRIDYFKRAIEHQGCFVVWPKLINFFDDWFSENIAQDNVFLPNTIWYRLRGSTADSPSGRRLLIFVHGGGMIAGSPLKYNSFHWITTLAWLGGQHDCYTDLVSLDYRLSPEYEAPESLIDCLRQMHEVCLRIKKASEVSGAVLERVHLIGFSAGAMLALQIALILEYAKKKRLGSPVFEITINEQLKSLANVMYDDATRFDLYLCSPLTRLDRLFLNRHSDLSATLHTFSRVFTRSPSLQDPLYAMQTHQLQLDCPDQVWLIDASRNSLSNHTIQLTSYLQSIEHKRFSTTLFDKKFFKLNQVMIDKIMLFWHKKGIKIHRFLRNFEQQDIPCSQISTDGSHCQWVNAMYYHFFMFIVPTEAAWQTLKLVLGAC